MFVEHKEAIEVTPAPAKVQKISEAIRIGAEKRPQCSKILYDGRGTCAIGAALEARGFDLELLEHTPENTFAVVMLQLIPELRNGLDEGNDLWHEVSNRNDEGQTREQIADWLEAQGY